MKGKFGIVIMCLLCQIVVGQTNSRKALHGQVVNKSAAIENGNVMNINANTRTFIGPNGLFDIVARPKDTLLFTGLAFQSKKIVLTEKDCAEKLFTVPLDLVNIELKEVLVHKELKVKSLQGGSQGIVDLQLEDDKLSSPTNTAMYSDQTIKYGTDFVRIFKDVKKLLRKNEEVKDEEVSDIAFVEYAKDNFTPEFYTKTLGLKEDEIELFLMYCSNDAESKRHLETDQKFELMDFMVNKNKDFKKVELKKK